MPSAWGAGDRLPHLWRFAHGRTRPGGDGREAHVCRGDSRRRAAHGLRYPARPVSRTPGQISVAVTLDSIEDAERVFQALSKHGKIDMPMAPTFWATCFGALTDKFGVTWLVNFENR